MRSRRLVLATLALAVAPACKRDWITIPVQPAQLVIHGVLDPAGTMQFVLIERTITGSVTTPLTTPFNPAVEPIYSDGGIAERHATTEIIGPNGEVYTGSEVTDCLDALGVPITSPPCAGTGGGVYKFFLSGTTLVPGGRYQFRATTTKGEVIDAETIIPPDQLVTTATAMTYNRSSDTLELSWPASPRAPAYQVRIESPRGAWFSFTDSTRVALTGALRNPDDPRLSHVFQPGFRQVVTVTAIDANMYDYYRTTNNSFVGYGSVSRVRGALGFFGAAVIVARRNVTVTANQTRPVEGVFDGIDTGLGYVYLARTLSLFVESPAARSTDSDAITGLYYNTTAANAPSVVGTFRGNRLTLAFLRNQAINDTLDVLTADLRGDSIIGRFRQGAPALFIKRR